MKNFRTKALLLAFSALSALMLALAPAAMAESTGEGLMGRLTDKTITFFCFGVMIFFTVLVIVLSLIQGRLDARKDQRRYDIDRFK